MKLRTFSAPAIASFTLGLVFTLLPFHSGWAGGASDPEYFYQDAPALLQKYGGKFRTAVQRYKRVKYAFRSADPFYSATVRSIDPLADGTRQVTFHATDLWARSEDAPFDPNADYSHIEPSKISLDYREMTGPVDREFRYIWTDTSRPLPLYVGQEVEIGTDSSGEVTLFCAAATKYLAVRKNSQGRVEVVMEYDVEAISSEKRTAEPPKLYIVPDYLDLQITFFAHILWRKDLGLSIVDARQVAGDVAEEEEQGVGEAAGWRMANESSVRVKVGQNGWIPYEDTPLGDGYHFEAYIPDSQYMIYAVHRYNTPEGSILRKLRSEDDGITIPTEAEGEKMMRQAREMLSAGRNTFPTSSSMDSTYDLAEAYRKGTGKPKDAALAATYYKQAAEGGHAAAQHRLGVCYALGSGVAQDQESAVFWYQKAAEQGFAEAQYDLGVRYIVGKGVSQDESTGVEWYKKAAAQGFQEAIEALEKRGLR